MLLAAGTDRRRTTVVKPGNARGLHARLHVAPLCITTRDPDLGFFGTTAATAAGLACCSVICAKRVTRCRLCDSAAEPDGSGERDIGRRHDGRRAGVDHDPLGSFCVAVIRIVDLSMPVACCAWQLRRLRQIDCSGGEQQRKQRSTDTEKN